LGKISADEGEKRTHKRGDKSEAKEGVGEINSGVEGLAIP